MSDLKGYMADLKGYTVDLKGSPDEGAEVAGGRGEPAVTPELQRVANSEHRHGRGECGQHGPELGGGEDGGQEHRRARAQRQGDA
eukprot:131147-Prorocentrum_minimum.AAC.2